MWIALSEEKPEEIRLGAHGYSVCTSVWDHVMALVVILVAITVTIILDAVVADSIVLQYSAACFSSILAPTVLKTKCMKGERVIEGVLAVLVCL
jgi:hypothetical protein